MFLSQIKKLRELQEQHAHSLAYVKQQGETFTDDREKLAALALFELNLKITDAIHEYAETIGDDDAALLASVALLAGAAGALSGFIGRSDPKSGEKVLAIAGNYQQLQYEKHK